MTAADLLRRAATKLRETAQAATPGPWAEPYEVDDTNPPEDRGWWVHGGTGMREHAVAVALPYSPNAAADAKLIALVHPPVALALADLLDDRADRIDQAMGGRWHSDASQLVRQTFRAEFALAAAVLRKPEETDRAAP